MSEFKGVQLKRSTTAGAVPEAAQLVEGELAINLLDKKLYSKNATTVFELKGTVDDGSITTPKLASGVASTIVTAALNAVYPIGSQYVNFSDATNPATLLGIGNWTAIAGRVVVGLDSTDSAFDTAGETGGSKNAVVVSHTHGGGTTSTASLTGSFTNSSNSGYNVTGVFSTINTFGGNGGEPQTNRTVGFDASHNHTIEPEGVSATNANLQPYVVAYVWKRTA